jgi:YD repeat-containing protein
VSTRDVLGRETRLKTGTLDATTYTYDGLDRLTKVTDPALVDTTFTYNAYGQTKTRVDFASITPATTTFTYDPAGRLDIEDGPRTGVTDSLSYDYDLAGRLTSAKRDGITLPGGGIGVTTSYLWDDASERVRVSQPLTSSLTHVRDLTYDGSGRMASFLENGTTTTYTYGEGVQNSDRSTSLHVPTHGISEGGGEESVGPFLRELPRICEHDRDLGVAHLKAG